MGTSFIISLPAIPLLLQEGSKLCCKTLSPSLPSKTINSEKKTTHTLCVKTSPRDVGLGKMRTLSPPQALLLGARELKASYPKIGAPSSYPHYLQDSLSIPFFIKSKTEQSNFPHSTKRLNCLVLFKLAVPPQGGQCEEKNKRTERGERVETGISSSGWRNKTEIAAALFHI